MLSADTAPLVEPVLLTNSSADETDDEEVLGLFCLEESVGALPCGRARACCVVLWFGEVPRMSTSGDSVSISSGLSFGWHGSLGMEKGSNVGGQELS